MIMQKRLIWTLLALLCASVLVCAASAAPTTELHVAKIADDGVTVIHETTVDYRWMEENLPILGDGVTHYYHQGPVFEGDKWDPLETTNFKDRGAVKGTDIRDLVELVGGAEPGDEIMVRAADGYHVEFAYENVYEPDPRQGPMGSAGTMVPRQEQASGRDAAMSPITTPGCASSFSRTAQPTRRGFTYTGTGICTRPSLTQHNTSTTSTPPQEALP